MLDQLLRVQRRNPVGAYLAPTFGAAKRISWEYLKDAVMDIPGVEIREGDLKVIIPRIINGVHDKVAIMLLGAENPGAIRGIYLDYVVMDEYAEMDPTVWTQVIRPALSDRKGKATFIFTPKGNNHAYELYRYAVRAMKDVEGALVSEWFSVMLKASQTKIIDEVELSDARSVMDESAYMQEYECDFSAALVGSYYKEEMNRAIRENRITRVPYDSHTGVITAWDLGVDDATAIWFLQETSREIHAIDYMEFTGVGLDRIVKELREKPYDYSAHIFPHDIKVRELSTGKSRYEILRDKLKLKNMRVAKKLSLQDGIAAVRSILGKVWFDDYNCVQGIECLKGYEREFDSKNNVFRTHPKRNWAIHGADAFRTFAVGHRLEEDTSNSKELPRQAEGDYDVLGW